MTRVALEDDDGIATIVSEILNGVRRNEDNRAEPADAPLSTRPVVTLATVDGKPFAMSVKDRQGRATLKKDPAAHLRGYKVGTYEMDSRQLRRLKAQGRSEHIYREFGSLFDVDASLALAMIKTYGYHVRYPTFRRRGGSHPILAAMLFEVDGPLQHEVISEYGWVDPRSARTRKGR